MVIEIDEVEFVMIDSFDGLNILCYLVVYVFVQVVQCINLQVNFGIGLFIIDGFYYDFGVEIFFMLEDFKVIMKEMQCIV